MIGTAKIRQSKAPSMTLKNLPKTSAGKINSVETEMIHKVKRKTRKRQKNKPKSKSNQAKKNKSQMIWCLDWKRKWAKLQTNIWQRNQFKNRWQWRKCFQGQKDLPGHKNTTLCRIQTRKDPQEPARTKRKCLWIRMRRMRMSKRRSSTHNTTMTLTVMKTLIENSWSRCFLNLVKTFEQHWALEW